MPVDTFTALQAAICPLDTSLRRARYERGEFPRSELCEDLNKRYRWDLLWEARIAHTFPDNLTDAHIDTALRRLIPPL